MLPAPSSTLPQLSPSDRAALLDAKNSLVGSELERPLAPDVRQRLTAVAVAIDQSRVRSTKSEIAREIASLMVAFRSVRAVSNEEAAATTREYVDLLADLPLWAIQAGFRKIKLGEVPDVSLDFPPAAPRVRRVVTDLMEPMLADRYDIRRVLSARVMPPENPERAAEVRALIGKGFRDLAKQLDDNHRAAIEANMPAKPAFRAPSIEELQEIYKTRPLPGPSERNRQRNVVRNGDVTVDEDGDLRSALAR
jgi:hypothetical protein